jgi:hypothetical protein
MAQGHVCDAVVPILCADGGPTVCADAGDFDYQMLIDVRPSLAPLFFWLSNTVLLLVFMNMFIAILTLFFEQVHRVRRELGGNAAVVRRRR